MMRSRLLLNLVLLVVVTGLVILVVKTPKNKDVAPVTHLTKLTPEDIQRIELQRQNGKTIILVKQNSTWLMQAPYQLEANDYRVQALLRLSQAEYQSQHDLEGRDPALYGLEQPLSTITYNGSLTIDFGENEPLSQQRYARIGQSLYLIPDTYYYHTISPATGYLSHALLPEGKITSLSMPGLALTQHNGQWHAQPAQPQASADALTELIANWRAAQGLRLEPYQGKLPQADIQVILDSREEPIRFTLQRQDGKLSLLRHDAHMRYAINKEIHDQLLKLPEPVPEPKLEKQTTN
ncbi:MAG: DUF4340 domain-containing protein [Thiohalophilus sp.]|jgi:hypothetical protein